MKIVRKQQGFALLATIMIAVIVIIVTGTLVFKMSAASRNIVRVQHQDKAINIAEEGLEHVMDWLNNRNNPVNYSKDIREGIKIVEVFDVGTHFVDVVNAESFNLYGVYNFPEKDHTVTSGIQLAGLESQMASLTPASTGKPNVYNSVRTLSGHKGQFKINMIVSPKQASINSSKYDLIELRSTSYFPDMANPQEKRQFVALIQRPKEFFPNWNEAIISENPINLQNAGTDDNDVVSLTAVGHVHTNEFLTIGTNGQVNGDASASQGMDPYPPSSSQVTGTATPDAPEKPIPEVSYDTEGLPECPTVEAEDGKLTLSNCFVNGPLDVNNYTLEVVGTVHIKGDYKESGNGTIIPGSPLSRLVVDGTLKTAGNASFESFADNRMIFIGKTSIEVKGNSDVQGIFYLENPDGEMHVTGNAEILGAIVSKGKVTFSGNNPKIIRDVTLNTEQIINPDMNAYKMRLVSWKEVDQF